MKRSQVIGVDIQRSHAVATVEGVWQRNRQVSVAVWRKWRMGSMKSVRYITYEDPSDASIERVHRLMIQVAEQWREPQELPY